MKIDTDRDTFLCSVCGKVAEVCIEYDESRDESIYVLYCENCVKTRMQSHVISERIELIDNEVVE